MPSHQATLSPAGNGVSPNQVPHPPAFAVFDHQRDEARPVEMEAKGNRGMFHGFRAGRADGRLQRLIGQGAQRHQFAQPNPLAVRWFCRRGVDAARSVGAVMRSRMARVVTVRPKSIQFGQRATG